MGSIGRLFRAAAAGLVLAMLALVASEPQHSDGKTAPQCSRAAAKVVLREHPRLHPFAPLFTAAGPVLCGSLLGPGSDAMVVSFKAATCGGTAGWAAFRRHAEHWNIVWLQRDGQRSIAKVGADIEETLSILRPTDPRCVPTGGTKSRVWHWNGARFVPGSWSFHYLNPEHFISPDRRISCDIEESEASCSAVNAETGSDHGGHLTRAGRVSVCSVAQPSLYESCFVQWDPHPPVLPYGQASELNGFRCTSAVDGVTCIKASAPSLGKGFRVSQDEAVEIAGG